MFISKFLIYCPVNQLVVGHNVYIESVKGCVAIIISFVCDLDISQPVFTTDILVNIDADFTILQF